MNQPSIYITITDKKKLKDLIWEAQHSEYRGSAYLQMLADELDRAQVVDPYDIPPDVITLKSTAHLIDLEADDEMIYTLVFPDEADISQGRISILAPIGTAMLGFRVGDIFEWDTPGGKRRIRVEKVIYQPEAAGDYQ